MSEQSFAAQREPEPSEATADELFADLDPSEVDAFADALAGALISGARRLGWLDGDQHDERAS